MDTTKLREAADGHGLSKDYLTADLLTEAADEVERLRSLLYQVASAKVVGVSEEHEAVALHVVLVREIQEASGYDEMGQ